MSFVLNKKKPLSILERKIHPNPRYAKIQSSIDTGATLKNVQVMSEKSVAKRRGELFSRIRCITLHELLMKQETMENIQRPGSDNPHTDVVHDMKSNLCEQFSIIYLVDTRDSKEFQTSHIDGAVNYPISMLLQDKVSRELHSLRRKSGKMLVIYHNDDKSSILPATTFAQKGWDDVYMLSGGIEEFKIKFPENLVLSTMKSSSTPPCSLLSP